ncbi:MAG: hypothetical protein U5R14_06260 [Gemmatimonadota bacterium]|nr:hypothetical protein [Gemmatimonadota bacterium]
MVFKTSEADLGLAVSDTVSGLPVLSHNNKSLFILVIDIFPHSTTASQRGRLEVREITETDLLELVT